jgi:amidase
LLKLFERYDYIALPTTRVCPFPLNHDWPTQIAGRPKETYHRWIEVAVP